MYARSDMPISFPGLFGDWEFNPSPVAINFGNGIYWYGILICLGLILAVLFCSCITGLAIEIMRSENNKPKPLK